MGIRIVNERIESNPCKAHLPQCAEEIMTWDEVAHNLNLMGQLEPELGTNNTPTNCRAIQTSALKKLRTGLMDFPDVRELLQTAFQRKEYAELEKEWREHNEDIDARNARMRT